MPDNPPPAAKPESSSEPIEFNFDKPASEIPRMKRRSLKGKTPGLTPANPPATARDLEREAPPLTADEAAKPAAPVPDAQEAPSPRPEPAQKSTPVAPPRSTPVVAAKSTVQESATATQRPAASAEVSTPSQAQKAADTAGTKPANTNGVTPPATGQKVNIALTSQQKATAAVLAASRPVSPHGTRPATLYYTSQPKKEASDSMKTTPTASSAAKPTPSPSASAASAARPAQATNAASSAPRPASTATAANPAARPVTAAVSSTTAPRPAASNFDYRANVERQSREQKSVGNILVYFVYGLIAFFVIGAGLATYGTVVIFDRLHEHATSISSLDDKFSQKVADLDKQLAATQDTLTLEQSQTARQLDLINKQAEEINQLRTALNAASSDSADAIHAESRARAQEAAALKARIRDLEYKTSLENSATRP